MNAHPPLIIGQYFYCPICNAQFHLSEHLKTVFADNQQTLWLANMVTHYRHHHIKWWNKCWGHNGGYYRGVWFGEYASQKINVNESAKRQIIRKVTQYLFHHKINAEHFDDLENTDEKTLLLAIKKLS